MPLPRTLLRCKPSLRSCRNTRLDKAAPQHRVRPVSVGGCWQKVIGPAGVGQVVAPVQQQVLEHLMRAYLTLLAEVRGRLGDAKFQGLKERLLNNWQYRSGCAGYTRGIWYALFDTASLWVIRGWISPCPATTVQRWRSFQAGFGFDLGLTS